MTKPVWFLDIDGVINSFPTPPKETEWEFVNTTILGYSIWYAPELIEFIDSIHESGDVEVRWLTTWTDRANESFAPGVGLRSRFEVEPRQHSYGDYSWWKADQVALFRQANPDTPFIWTDDDMDYYSQHVKTVTEDATALIIQPWTDVGLTQLHLNIIREFVEEFR